VGIKEIYFKSLKESFKLRRLLPFFLLYLFSSLISCFFFLPILSLLPNILTLKFSQENLNLILLNSSIILIIFLIAFILNCWLAGALVYDVWRKEGLKAGFKFSKKLLTQILSLNFVLAFLNLFFALLGSLGLILRVFSSLIFLFSLPLLIIKREDFLSAMKGSYELVSKNLLNSFLFWLFLYLIYYSILFASFFLVIFSVSPLLSRIISLYQIFSSYGEFSQAGLIQIIGLLTNTPESIAISLTIFSFFFSYSYVFLTTAKTNYFLFLGKRLISSNQS
jgi:hypothetical protein